MKTNKHIAALLAQIEQAENDIETRQSDPGDSLFTTGNGVHDTSRWVVETFDRLDKIREALKSINAALEELDKDIGCGLGRYQGECLDENTGDVRATVFFDSPIPPPGWIKNPKRKKISLLDDFAYEVPDGPEYVRSTEVAVNNDTPENAVDAIAAQPIQPTTIGRKDIRNAPSPNPADAIVISLTEGMIDQNMLTFTVNRKPIFKGGEKIIIHFGGEKITSEIVKPSYRLRERGAVKRFYKANDARKGDRVVLIKNELGEFVASIKKQVPAEIPSKF